MHQVVWPASGDALPAGCVGGGAKARPPQSWMSSPRWRLYQARRTSASRALKKTPPIPVTRCIAFPSARAVDPHRARHLVMPALLARVEGDPGQAREQRDGGNEVAHVARQRLPEIDG